MGINAVPDQGGGSSSSARTRYQYLANTDPRDGYRSDGTGDDVQQGVATRIKGEPSDDVTLGRNADYSCIGADNGGSRDRSTFDEREVMVTLTKARPKVKSKPESVPHDRLCVVKRPPKDVIDARKSRNGFVIRYCRFGSGCLTRRSFEFINYRVYDLPVYEF
jgi:hypothetical protein